MSASEGKNLLWGFCDSPEIIQSLKKGQSFFNISDSSFADINIFKVFNKKIVLKNNEPSIYREKIEHAFVQFKEFYSRHFFAFNLTENDYRESFNYYIDFFTSLITDQKLTSFVSSNIPHEGPEYIAAEIFKLQGKKVFFCYQSIFPNRFFISNKLKPFSIESSPEFIGELSELEKGVDRSIESIGNWFYMSDVKKTKDLSLYNLFKNSRRNWSKKIGVMLNVVKKQLRFFIEYHLIKKKIKDLDNLDYVYFPLHLQPELTTSALGNGYGDQLIALNDLRKKLPKEIAIIVKENPKQDAFMREDHFYRKIQEIPNLFFAPMSFNSIELLKKSQAVVTITGTIGWEAINIGKPVFVYGNSWFSELPNITDITKVNHINVKGRDITSANEVRSSTVNFLKSFSFEGVVDNAYKSIYPKYDSEKNAQQVSKIINQLLGENVDIR